MSSSKVRYYPRYENLVFAYILGTEEEHIEFCFSIYDLNDDGFISREEMLTMMANCLFKNKTYNEDDGDEGVKVKINI